MLEVVMRGWRFQGEENVTDFAFGLGGCIHRCE